MVSCVSGPFVLYCLLRTENMLLRPSRINVLYQTILANTTEERQRHLQRMQHILEQDLVGVFRAVGENEVGGVVFTQSM